MTTSLRRRYNRVAHPLFQIAAAVVSVASVVFLLEIAYCVLARETLPEWLRQIYVFMGVFCGLMFYSQTNRFSRRQRLGLAFAATIGWMAVPPFAWGFLVGES